MNKDARIQHAGHDTPVWHQIAPGEVLEKLGSDPRNGLSSAEAARRLQVHGANTLPAVRKRPPWMRFLLQFHNVLIYVLLVAATITAMLQHWIDTGVLLGAVIINAIIGYIQEGKAEDALDAIRNMLSPRTIVLRDSTRAEIAAKDLVPGDIVALASGDKVPADLRIVAARSLRASEAVLTGESEAVEKSPDPVDAEAALGDRSCMLYSGTLVASGQATGVVVATGKATEIGRISTLLEQVDSVTTPLLRQIARFSHWLAMLIAVLVVATFVLGVLWRGIAPAEMFMMAVALSAAAIPEGLPAIMTITLAMGVRRMASHNAIIRRLPAVETLGSVTVICSDKTGTLTRNEMAVQRAVTANHVFEISGVGYAPTGAFHVLGAAVQPGEHPGLIELCRAAALCNDASLSHRDGEWQMQGDPTEGALLTLGLKAGLDLAAEAGSLPRTDVIPFESEHRLMATLHHDHEGRGIIYVKGAPERILDFCDLQGQDGTPLDPDYWRRQATDLAARGLRVLAVAAKPVPGEQREVRFSDLESGARLLGLLGIIDPPREEAVAAVAECHAAGIRVKMITGDHVDTARAIGAQLGIGRGKPSLTGAEIELMDDSQLREVVGDVDVYARASPEHKLRLVEAMQANGQVVSMTGDGVNDAPALKRADVGVAMGLKGTEAAKEAAHMVLADDNFATIGNAVREGRAIYDNIRKYVLFVLPTNGGESLLVVASILFNLPLPLTAAQVLWINLATSSTLGISLAFEPPEQNVMRRQPRDPRQPLLSWFFVWRVAMISFLIFAGAMGLFLWETSRGSSIETARTMAVSSVVVAEMFYLFSSRHVLHSTLSREGIFGNPKVLISISACTLLQLSFVYAPPMQKIFGSTALGADEWLLVLLAGAMILVATEMEKLLIRRTGWTPRGIT